MIKLLLSITAAFLISHNIDIINSASSFEKENIIGIGYFNIEYVKNDIRETMTNNRPILEQDNILRILEEEFSHIETYLWRFKVRNEDWIPWEETNIEFFFDFSNKRIEMDAAKRNIIKIIEIVDFKNFGNKKSLIIKTYNITWDKHITMTFHFDESNKQVCILMEFLDSSLIEYKGIYD